MKLFINKNNLSASPAMFLRQAGYSAVMGRESNQDSYSRRLGSGLYPRFHIYIEENNEQLIFNLHLDQKRPSYPGAHAHSGEYDGDLVEQEIERIKGLVTIYK
jgi:hypothetical protein